MLNRLPDPNALPAKLSAARAAALAVEYGYDDERDLREDLGFMVCAVCGAWIAPDHGTWFDQEDLKNASRICVACDNRERNR